jgi:REase_AHJR-like
MNSFMSGLTTRPVSFNFLNDAMELEALHRIAKRYRDDGYDVIIDPRGDRVPPFAVGFELDLVATRGNKGVVVEIKTNRFDLSHDPQIMRLAQVVNAQPGWRLDVVVLESETAVEKAAQKAAEPSDEQLAQILKAAEELADQGYSPYACVVAWGGLEAAMRRVRDGAERYGRATPAELMRTLYGNGFLSREQFDRLKESYKIRSQVVHGLVPPQVDPELVRYVTATARYLAHDEAAALPSS